MATCYCVLLPLSHNISSVFYTGVNIIALPPDHFPRKNCCTWVNEMCSPLVFCWKEVPTLQHAKNYYLRSTSWQEKERLARSDHFFFPKRGWWVLSIARVKWPSILEMAGLLNWYFQSSRCWTEVLQACREIYYSLGFKLIDAALVLTQRITYASMKKQK